MMNDSDSSWVAQHSIEAVQIIREAWIAPSVLYSPRLLREGNQWCALYGEDLQNGVAGFGASPKEAMAAFDRAWFTKAAGGQ